jgi:hypothetical protein
MTTYTQRNNWNWLAWLLVLISAIMFIIALTSCTKPPDTPVNCDCGHIVSNTNDGELWTVVVKNDCSGDKDTTVWHFNMDDCKVGDVVCELKEIEL